jgi:hypothetical protein
MAAAQRDEPRFDSVPRTDAARFARSSTALLNRAPIQVARISHSCSFFLAAFLIDPATILLQKDPVRRDCPRRDRSIEIVSHESRSARKSGEWFGRTLTAFLAISATPQIGTRLPALAVAVKDFSCLPPVFVRFARKRCKIKAPKRTKYHKLPRENPSQRCRSGRKEATDFAH